MNLIPRRLYWDNLFDDFLISGTNNLKCDIYEKDNTFFLEADIPGFKKEDINVEAEDGYLLISASKEEEKKEEDKNYLRRERYSSSYERQFYLGNIDEDNVKAEFKDGTLKIIVPKKEELPNSKKIEIE
ncbi:MAG: Hsp20/alpha crystallin family protein [Bacilli bacterium]|nr:Hsp20/alpha crystallin family protein [Bacilli bacterium]MDD3305120.1 Hsp20/alpha crystallin family protein [Bacilli bacterium]MDD4053347.1 Hsp20/alpha crystallin family protein [Bacilli bacterium]MDD4411006.1 Hsp20/alpha crystallin family protein [Bacilli bacterium]